VSRTGDRAPLIEGCHVCNFLSWTNWDSADVHLSGGFGLGGGAFANKCARVRIFLGTPRFNGANCTGELALRTESGPTLSNHAAHMQWYPWSSVSPGKVTLGRPARDLSDRATAALATPGAHACGGETLQTPRRGVIVRPHQSAVAYLPKQLTPVAIGLPPRWALHLDPRR
jgi:hypothetical protein